MARAILRVQRGEARASSTLTLAYLTICERPFALPMPTSTCDNRTATGDPFEAVTHA